MKNETINIGDPIPDEIRLEVYKEAKVHIENAIKNPEYDVYGLEGFMGLCTLLPCILYDLETFEDDQPNGLYWEYELTPVSFPELAGFIEKIDKIEGQRERNKMRLKFLNSSIKKLSK